MAEQIQEVFWLTSAECQQLLYVSPAFEVIWGRPVKSLFAYPGSHLNVIVDSIHPSDRERVRVALTNLDQDEYKAEYQIVRPDGSIRWVRSRSFPIQNEFGETWAIAGLSEDITQRKRAKEILQQREQEFRALVENSPDIIARFDGELRYVYVNPAVELTSGKPPEAYIGKTIYEVGMPQAVIALWEQSLQRILQTCQEDRIEFSLLTPDGLKYYQSRGVPELAADNSIKSILRISRDITKNKQTEEALRESEERCRTVFEFAPIGIAIANKNAILSQINQAFQEILGYTQEELQHLPFTEFTHPDDQPESLRLFQELVEGKRTHFSQEKRYLRQDGRMVWGNVSVSGVFDANGSFQYAIAMLQDISAQKQAQLELQNAHAELEKRVTERTLELAQANTRLKQEIAERCQVQEALQAQRNFFQTVIDTNPNSIFVKDRDDKFVLTNQAFADFYAITVEELIGKTTVQLHPDQSDTERFIAQDQEVFTTSKQKLILEELVCTPARGMRWLQTIKKPIFSSDGQVYQVLGVSADITERKLAEEALKAQKEFLQTIIDHNPNQIFVKDRSGKYVLANQAFAEFHGRTVDEIVGFTDIQLTPHQAELEQFLAQDREVIATSRQKLIAEQIDRTSTGEIRWFQVIKKPLLDGEGQVCQILGVSTDITERKLAEEQLRQSEQRLHLALKAAHMGFWDWHLPTGKVTRSSDLEQMLGWVPNSQKDTKNDFLATVHPEDRDRLCQVEQHSLETGEECEVEFRIIWPDGSIRWMESKSRIICDTTGKPLEMTGINLDITERKQSQIALQVQHELFQTVIDANPSLIFVKDIEGKFVLANQTYANYCGVPIEELLGKSDADLNPNGFDVEQYTAQDRDVFATLEEIFIPEDICHSITGEVRWFQTIKKPLFDRDGKVYQVLGVSTDITQHKLIEEQLRQSEEQLRLALEAAGMVGWNWDFQTGKITGSSNSNNFRRLYGYDPKPEGITYEESLEIVHPEDRDRVRQAEQHAIKTGDKYDIEFRIIWPDDGSIRWLESKGQVIYSETGKPIRMIGINLDISDRKFAEEQLRQSEEQLSLAMKSARMGYWNWNLQTGFVNWSHHLQRVYEFLPHNFQGSYEQFLAIVHPEDRDFVRQVDRHCIETGENFNVEFRLVLPDGKIRWIESKGQTFYDEIGNPVRMAGIDMDISERKQAEEQLRRSQEQLRLALDAARMSPWERNLQTETITFSSNLEQLYGFAPNTYDGTYETYLARIHPQDRDRIHQATQNAITMGKAHDLEFRIIWPDGSIRWIETKGQVIYNEMGSPVLLSGISLDISDRKQAETEIKESLREKEVLLQEIHHRVKNNLQVISSLLDLQSQRLKDTATLEMFQESQNRIKLMALVHETLYKSKDFAKINFSEYVQNLASYLFRAYTVETSNIALELNLDEVSLKLDKAIPCGLIISELVSNSLKYAFPSQTDGKICIITKSDKNNHFKIIVRDNGVGFPVDLNFRSLNSLGLQLVNVLIEQIEGSLEIDSSRGTEFTIRFSELSD